MINTCHECGLLKKQCVCKTIKPRYTRDLMTKEEMELFDLACQYKVGGSDRYDRAMTMQLHMKTANMMGMKIGDYLDSLPKSREQFMEYKKTANWGII